MRINRGREKGTRSKRRSGTFTGTVWGDEVLTDPNGKVTVGSVFFEPGARTYWHRHTEGQVLYVTHGQGRVRSRDGSGGTIAAGDVVHIAPGEEHWHGAGPDSFMLHHAITIGKSDWLTEVSDEEYNKAFT
ncbi:MAG TPA: cupin domain-containing protein [bacterium]|nr:cupin domain-containing protein [bacterium]